jgi:hypothetical protein
MRVYAFPVGPREDRSGIIGLDTQRCRVPTRHPLERKAKPPVFDHAMAGGFAVRATPRLHPAKTS